MRSIYNSFALVTVATLLSFSLVACHSQSPGTGAYMPSVTSGVPSTTAASSTILPDRRDIKSTCGRHVHIIVAGFVGCRFLEKGYKGNFTIYNHASGLVSITPTSGTRKTKFVVTGIVVGHGVFLVKDDRGHKLKIRVRVTL